MYGFIISLHLRLMQETENHYNNQTIESLILKNLNSILTSFKLNLNSTRIIGFLPHKNSSFNTFIAISDKI